MVTKTNFIESQKLWNFIFRNGIICVSTRSNRYQYIYNKRIFSFTDLEGRIYIPKIVALREWSDENFDAIEISNNYLH